MNSSGDIAWLIEAHPERHRRVFAADWNGQRVWVKRAAKNHANWFLRLIGALRGVMGKHEDALEQEILAMQALNRNGFLTPQILHQGKDWFVLSDLGTTLQDRFNKAGDPERRDIARAAGKSLGELHSKNRWHGAAKLANMAGELEHIGYIDFEGTRHGALSLPQKQALDLFMLGCSVSRYDPSGRTSAICFQSYGDRNILALTKRYGLAFRPVHFFLKPFAAQLPRDVLQAVACLTALYEAKP